MLLFTKYIPPQKFTFYSIRWVLPSQKRESRQFALLNINKQNPPSLANLKRHPMELKVCWKMMICWVGRRQKPWAGLHGEPVGANRQAWDLLSWDSHGLACVRSVPTSGNVWWCGSGASFSREGSIIRKKKKARPWADETIFRRELGMSFRGLLRLSFEEKAATISLLSLKTSLLTQMEKVEINHSTINDQRWRILKMI